MTRVISDSPRRAPRRRRWASVRVEALEDRSLLSSVVFADGFGPGDPNSPTTVQAVASDSGGAQYITGGFSGTVTFGNLSVTSAGSSDIFVAKLNPSGTTAWVNRGGGSNTTTGEYGRAIAVDKDGNSYVTGYFNGPATFTGQLGTGATLPGKGNLDVFVAKYDIQGRLLWAKAYGGSQYDFGQSIAVDGSGNVYVTGSFQGSMGVGPTTLTAQGFNDAFVMKLDASGNPVWAKSFGSTGDDSGYSIAVDVVGNIYTSGRFFGNVDFGPTTLHSTGPTTGYLVKLSNAGNVIWAKSMGGTDIAASSDGTYGVAIDPNNNNRIYVTGTITGSGSVAGVPVTANSDSADILFARFDAAGNVTWAEPIGGAGYDTGLGVTTDGSGNVYGTGYFNGSMTAGGATLVSNGGRDAFLIKLDPNGAVVSAEGYGSPNNDESNMASINPINSNVTVVGDYAGAMNVNGVPLPPTATGFAFQVSQGTRSSEPPGDFLKLGYTQAGMYTASTADWSVYASDGSVQKDLGSFGTPRFGDIPVPGDYNGAGYTQQAIFIPSNATWKVRNADGSATTLGQFGGQNLLDIPVPGDYDGIGKTELTVFRPSGPTAQWYILRPNGGQLLAAFGSPKLDIPVPGDYDGTGRTQLAVFRPSTGEWFVLRPNGGQTLVTFGGHNFLDIPVPGDWDHVGYTEPAVFRPSTGQIFVYGPQGGQGPPVGHVVATLPADTWNYAKVPVLASIGMLLKLGKIPPGGAGAVQAASAPSPSSTASAGSAVPATSASPTGGGGSGGTSPVASAGSAGLTSSTTAAAPVRTSPLAVRSAVVVNQGAAPSAKPDALSSALDSLYGLGL